MIRKDDAGLSAPVPRRWGFTPGRANPTSPPGPAKVGATRKKITRNRSCRLSDQLVGRRERDSLTLRPTRRRSGATPMPRSSWASGPVAAGTRWGFLGGRLDALLEPAPGTRYFTLGRFRGLTFGCVVHRNAALEVFLDGRATRRATLHRDSHGPRAVLNALEWLAAMYGRRCQELSRRIRTDEDDGLSAGREFEQSALGVAAARPLGCTPSAAGNRGSDCGRRPAAGRGKGPHCPRSLMPRQTAGGTTW